MSGVPGGNSYTTGVTGNIPDQPQTVDFTGLITTLQQSTVAINLLNKTIAAIFPRQIGTFTLAAAATTTVSNTAITATSQIVLQPTNAAAGTLMGSAKSLYISARTAGASFTVATASGAAAAGTEGFEYYVVNAV